MSSRKRRGYAILVIALGVLLSAVEPILTGGLGALDLWSAFPFLSAFSLVFVGLGVLTGRIGADDCEPSDENPQAMGALLAVAVGAFVVGVVAYAV